MDRQNWLESDRIAFSFLLNHVPFGRSDQIDLLAVALSMAAAATAGRGMDLSEIARTSTKAGTKNSSCRKGLINVSSGPNLKTSRSWIPR